MALENRIKKYWEGAADRYSKGINEELHHEVCAAWKKQILDNAPLPQENNAPLYVLDVGTGPGFFPIILSEAGHLVIGIDLTENMLKCAKENADAKGVHPIFMRMNCETLPFVNDTFDLILCRNLTWTLENPESTYREWLRVLRPGGRLLVFDANWNQPLFDEDLKGKLEENEARVKVEFGYTIHEDSNKDESYEIASLLPLSHCLRPQWDLEALANVGFSKVFAEINILEQTGTEIQKATYHNVTPPFMVGGEK